MKTKLSLLALTLALFSSTNLYAQVVQKGDFIAGINVSGQKYSNFDSTGTYIPTSRNLNFAPFISYGVARNLSVGTYVLLNNSNGSNFNFSKYNHDYAMAVFSRKYFPINKSIYGYVQGDLKYASIGNIYSTGKFTSNSLSLNLSGGLGYQFTKRVGLELGVNNLLSGNISQTRGALSNGTPTEVKNIDFTWRNVTQRNGLHVGVTFRF